MACQFIFHHVKGGRCFPCCRVLMAIHVFHLPASLKERLNQFNFLFWMEWIAVWAFSAAWLVKGQAPFADSFEEHANAILES